MATPNLGIDIDLAPKKEIKFKWTKKKLEAAELVADGRWTYVEIGHKIGIGPHSINAWVVNPHFKAKIATLLEMFTIRIMQSGMARKEKRVEFLKKMHDWQITVIEERAQVYAGVDSDGMPIVPGGSSGLVTLERKVAGFTPEGEPIWTEISHFDASFHKEVRATLDQIAEETGQKVRKNEVTGADGGPIAITIGALDSIAERVRAAKAKHGASQIQAQIAAPVILDHATQQVIEVEQDTDLDLEDEPDDEQDDDEDDDNEDDDED